MEKSKYIVVKDRFPYFSEVLYDCKTPLCVPASKGESLSSILGKICSKINQISGSLTYTFNDSDTIEFSVSNNVVTANVVGGNEDWTLSGNSGTTNSSFLGTTDNVNLRFKVNDQPSGRISNIGQTYFGYQAGISDVTEFTTRGNTGFGYQAMFSYPGTTGIAGSSAFGYQALYNFTGGGAQEGNLALGARASYSTTTGYRNVAVGNQSLYNNNANFCVAVGNFAGEWNSTGQAITAIGLTALRYNTTGTANTALGGGAMLNTTSRVASVTVTNGGTGYTTATVTLPPPDTAPLGSPQVGIQATATATILAGVITDITVTNPGRYYSSTTPVVITGDGTGATATMALAQPDHNLGVGGNALAGNITGSYNVGVGYNTGSLGGNGNSLTDSNMTFVGASSGRDSNVLNTTTLTYGTAVGSGAIVGQSNSIVLGRSSLDSVGIWTTAPLTPLHVAGRALLTSITSGTPYQQVLNNGAPATAYVTHTSGTWGFSIQRASTTLNAPPHLSFFRTNNADFSSLQPTTSGSIGQINFKSVNTSNVIIDAFQARAFLTSAGATGALVGFELLGCDDSTTTMTSLSYIDKLRYYITPPVILGGITPDASAKLQIDSTTQGVLLPRMTQAQRDAIASPVAGLVIYQTDATPGLRTYNGTNWMRYTETID